MVNPRGIAVNTEEEKEEDLPLTVCPLFCLPLSRYGFLPTTCDFPCGQSRVHRLTDDEQDLFVKGAENWFILTTPGSLGRVRSVVVWHDSSGSSPAWLVWPPLSVLFSDRLSV